MIAVDNLTIRVGKFRLERVSFAVATGQYAVLMGKTGSGKTTLLEGICGLKSVTSGIIKLLGRDVTALQPGERGIGYVPQDLALFQTMAVHEHLAFPLVIRHWKKRAIKGRVQELAVMLGLEHLLERLPRGLSGGESQRVALGRALAYRPAFLLLDEPLSALDEETREEMVSLLRTVQKQTGVTALHVTHSQIEAKKLADRLLLLKEGIVQEMDLRDLPPHSELLPLLAPRAK